VIYPLIVELDQFRRLRAKFDEAIADLGGDHLQHGIMFEVPSACLQAESLFEEMDFGCIGTNDLVQHLFGIDRTAGHVEDDELLAEPALWRTIAELSRNNL
jgi:phosphoenolpyruvate-protein kinase (PTS system EI component)